MACVFKTWRRMRLGGGPDWGKFQPVGSFEMEVTSSGLKKNCQPAPQLGWPLGSLHAARPLSLPPSEVHNPASGVYSPNSGLCMARGGSPGPTPGWNLYPGPGALGGQAWGHQKRPRKCVSFPVYLGDNAGSPGELGSLGLLSPDSEEPCPGSSPTEVLCRPQC